jgi:8-oxoguanine deaminase
MHDRERASLSVAPTGAGWTTKIAVARETGLRFHAARGSMSVGRSHGGLPPDEVVEDEAAILADTQRVIETFHDPARFAMTRIVVAPCSPFSVSEDLIRESIALARNYGVHSHTHLAETLDEERYCIERFGCRPVELAERREWTVGCDTHGRRTLATSNMRLGSGIAPVRALVEAGARVGLGVDGSASNDSSHMLDEVPQAPAVRCTTRSRRWCSAGRRRGRVHHAGRRARRSPA